MSCAVEKVQHEPQYFWFFTEETAPSSRQSKLVGRLVPVYSLNPGKVLHAAQSSSDPQANSPWLSVFSEDMCPSELVCPTSFLRPNVWPCTTCGPSAAAPTMSEGSAAFIAS